MKQAKKIITRMLINNWGGISHRMMEFHEYVNLFSGKSGSGKSTVMDAVQVVLYGSVSASFLNKAADDAKNRRSVMSYLRGAQKDGTSNRADQDFYSTLVLEVKDTGLHTTTCFGAVFEIGRTDMDINGKYAFFSHSGSIPEDGYLNADGVPYSKAQIRKLCETRKQSADNRGRVELNRIYPSREAYVATLYDVIMGGVDPTRLMTMEKSAIALRMTNGTGQFIRDYMFPRSQESAIEKISEQLGAYREIKEKVEDLEERIHMLDTIHESHTALVSTRSDMVRAEAILKYIEIESTKAHLEARSQDLQGLKTKIGSLETEQKEMMCKYKKIICKIFGEQIRVIGESSAIGPMGQFQIRFFYEPTKIYVTLDADRGAFTFDLKDEAKDWNTLYRIKKFDNCMTEKCLENAAVILKQVLEENKFPLYKSENDKLYKKQDGTYRRIKDIYAELAGGE